MGSRRRKRTWKDRKTRRCECRGERRDEKSEVHEEREEAPAA
eukprot:CAMPEP_0206586558 /NCGR_PEP_ID=MMETSP0325_2-20121206/37098_1 /ASSEMBLY_ACC=CAM_ASM_000347 /TAXON_ID=2866 /ORGANISM="Crypthecodinium cohnii, Strain Seligo" /LENGTH=41 /DNA_ID= /DNA_START= /DNA_END= /DNA_ORIENTATION=